MVDPTEPLKADATRLSEQSSEARNEILRYVYEELRRIAHHRMRTEPNGHLLQTTDLVNEALLRLLKSASARKHHIWADRRKLLGFAARVMRQVLTDYARKNKVRGGGIAHFSLRDDDWVSDDRGFKEIIEIDDLLSEFEKGYPLAGRIFELNHYAGASVKEIVETLLATDDIDITPNGVRKHLRLAKSWIQSRLEGQEK